MQNLGWTRWRPGVVWPPTFSWVVSPAAVEIRYWYLYSGLAALHPCRIRIQGLADPYLGVLLTFLTKNNLNLFLKIKGTVARDSFLFLFNESPSVCLESAY